MVRRLSFVLLLAACNAGDDTTDGARANCAQGGVLTSCPEAAHTSSGACWRLVDCAAIPLDAMNDFDWKRCVDGIDKLTAERQNLVIDCIAASSCDSLKVEGSPDHPNTNQMSCLLLGDQ
ncbi:MAG: hypothetical protein JO257_25255 [Deltaproteobacteria bacterium]|nr:hypothetical protein [Deltaproteobacteria bacterium]